MNCAEVEELRDLYALGALSADEADGVEEHIAACADCTQRVTQSWQVAQLLRQAVAAREPTPATRLRLLDTAARDQQDAPSALAPGPRPLAPSLQPPAPTPWRSARWVAAAALVPLLVSTWLAAQVVALQGQVGSSERALQGSWQNAQYAAEVMGKAVEQGGAMVALTGTDMAPTANGALYYLPGEREGVLVVAGLPPLERGQVYQLWLLSGSDRMSGGTFYLADDGRGMLVVKSPAPLTLVQTLGITNEPHGGSTAPQGKRYLWASMAPAQRS